MNSDKNKDIFRDIGYMVAAILLICIFFYRLILFPGFNPGADTRLYTIPAIKFLIDSFKRGIFPLWDPYQNSGVPFMMHGFISPYCPSFFIFFLFSIDKAINIQFLIHIFIAGFFTYLLARELELSRFSSSICAGSFIFSNLFIMCVGEGYLCEAVSIAYLPVLIFLFEIAQKKRCHLFSILGGVAVGFCLVGGHLIVSAMTLVAFCLYFLIRFFQRPQKFLLVSFFTIIFIGFFLAAIQWVPMAEAMQFSAWKEGAGELEKIKPHQLFNFISYNPHLPKQSHIGIVPLVLALFALLFQRNRSIIPFVVLVCVLVLILLGKFNRIFYLIPYYSTMLNSMYCWGSPLIFSISMLSGFGADLFVKKKKNSALESNLLKGFIFSIIILDLGYYIFSLPYSHKPAFSLDTYFRKEKAIDFLAKDESIFRILPIEKKLEKDVVFKPNQGSIYKYQSVVGNVKIPMRRYNEFITLIEGKPDTIIQGRNQQSFSLCNFRNYNSKLINLLNVKYIFTDEEIENEKFKLVFADEKIKIYENKYFQSRAFIVSEYKVIKTKDKIFGELKDGSFDFKETVILEEEPEIPFVTAKDNTESNVNIIKNSPNEILVETISSRDGFLVLSQIYMPGWKAYVDGKQTKVYQADYILQAIYLPNGTHKVRFVYSPFSFKLGLAMTFATLAVVSSYLTIYFLKRPSREIR